MASSSSTDPTPARPSRRLLAAGAGAAVVLAVAVAAVLAVRSGGDDTAPRFRPADRAFSVVLPAGWRAANDRELRTVPSAPAAVLRRADRRGLVVIRRRPAL